MSKPVKPADVRSKPEERLSWPQNIKDCSERPRLFRCERLNSLEWQAFVTVGNQEYPIGKPDLFDIVEYKIKCCLRAEGQRSFLAAKTRESIQQEVMRTTKLEPKAADAK